MGLIGDRKAKKQKEKEKEIEKLRAGQSKAGLAGVKGVGGGKMVARYPVGYYTTPAHQAPSWTGQSHPGQPRQQPNVNPRYQTWVAPRKQQPHLGQLVRSLALSPNSPSLQVRGLI